eukprot:tig00000402_g220.t1
MLARAGTATGARKSVNLPPHGGRGGEEDLEKQYIYNLQQQIYFLELELRFLRERGGAGGNASSKENDAPGGMVKSSHFELQMKEQLSAMQAKMDSLQEEALAAQYAMQQLTDERNEARRQLQTMKRNMEDDKKKVISELVQVAQENKLLKAELDKLTATDGKLRRLEQDNARLTQDNNAFQVEKRKLYSELDSFKNHNAAFSVRIDELTRQLAEKSSEAARLKATLDEREKNARAGDLSEMQEQDLMDKNRELSANNEVLKQQLATVQNSMKKLTEEMNDKLSKLEKEKKDMAAQLEKIKKGIQQENDSDQGKYISSVASATTHAETNKNLVIKNKQLEDRLEKSEILLREAHEKLKAALDRRAYLEQHLSYMEDEHRKDLSRMQELDTLNMELYNQNLEAQSRLEQFTREKAEMEQHLASHREQSVRHRAMIRQLKSKLQVSAGASAAEFQALMMSNQKVADSLHRMMSKIPLDVDPQEVDYMEPEGNYGHVHAGVSAPRGHPSPSHGNAPAPKH